MAQIHQYLESLLNRTVNPSEVLKLTSAQIARFVMYAEKNGLILTPEFLRNGFSLESLSANGFSNTPAKSLIGVKRQAEVTSVVLGVGIDIQLVDELFPEDETLFETALAAIFSSDEIEYSRESLNPRTTLAGIFSLKESLVKAGAQFETYRDLEISHDARGVPTFAGFQVSISHSGQYACSMAVRV